MALVSVGSSRTIGVQPGSPQNPAVFMARGVTPGEYQLQFSIRGAVQGPIVDWSGSTIRLEGRDISGGFRIDRTPDHPIDFVLELNRSTGTVTGSVVNNRMEPVPNVTVVLIPDARGSWKSASTDAAGNFQINSVA